MSLRRRLALWYGALFGLVLLVVMTLTYAVHTRSHYDDLDRALVSTASHAAAEADTLPFLAPMEVSGGLEVAVRRYDAGGRLSPGSPPADRLPLVDPRVVLAAPSGPAFDPVAGIAPPLGAAAPTAGAFGLTATAQQRWRIFVRPLGAAGEPRGYIEVIAPLDRLDTSMQIFRLAPLVLGLAGLAGALLGGWAIAGRALRPVATMTATAAAIAETRDLSRRIEAPAARDELWHLAATFNAMLESVELAYQAQQRFVADASHELRAPLTAIQGNLQLLRRHAAMPEAEREAALAEAEREAERLTRLVADLLALARADAGLVLRRGRVELDRLLLDALAAARHLARGQDIALDHLEPTQVAGDPERLRQLLLIVLDNALKYTLPPGRVVATLRRDGGLAEVTVRDSGIGITAADLPHIFERFYRADLARAREPGGTGLGLPIARWIVEQHGGTLAVVSAPGQGTAVTIRLPLGAEDAR